MFFVLFDRNCQCLTAKESQAHQTEIIQRR